MWFDSTFNHFFGRMFGRFGMREVRGGECVFVTGCDSGIGLSFAKHLASLGCIVFAGVLNEASEGAQHLRDLKGKGEVIVLQLDVTDIEKIVKCVERVEEGIQGRNLELSAVINNAGVMIFGEFEWQTYEQISRQLDVNVLGYMRVAKAFCPLLRKFNGRLINVSSHCSTVPLPCLSVYSATKAAIESWSSALALELFKFNVPVITIHPGSYAQESEILKNQTNHAQDMWKNMSLELQENAGPYFQPIMKYMSAVSRPTSINDPALNAVIRSAVFSRTPKHNYVNSPWRYSLYYGLISFVRPFWKLQRKIILSFINLPKYK